MYKATIALLLAAVATTEAARVDSHSLSSHFTARALAKSHMALARIAKEEKAAKEEKKAAKEDAKEAKEEKKEAKVKAFIKQDDNEEDDGLTEEQKEEIQAGDCMIIKELQQMDSNGDGELEYHEVWNKIDKDVRDMLHHDYPTMTLEEVDFIMAYVQDDFDEEWELAETKIISEIVGPELIEHCANKESHGNGKGKGPKPPKEEATALARMKARKMFAKLRL